MYSYVYVCVLPSITDSTISRVDNLLQQYIGTHNFHNFTSGKYVTVCVLLEAAANWLISISLLGSLRSRVHRDI